jgi:lycopene cyclase domain-containing protein
VNALYLLLDLAVLSIPLAFSWAGKLSFSSYWRAFFPACLLVLAGFVAWDIPFAAWGVWGFNDQYLLGPRIAGLPIEEWLFFLCIPYACTFTYFALDVLEVRWFERSATLLTAALAALSLGLAVAFWGRLYTSSTAVLLGGFCLWLLWKRPVWLAGLWTAFVALMPAFIVTNGVLTGLRFWEYPVLNSMPETIATQVVWYDNTHNLGVRLFCIPLDDFLYAFLLIGLNVALFEHFRRRRKRIA